MSRLFHRALLVSAFLLFATEAARADLVFDVKTDIQGSGTQTIGSIKATMTYTDPGKGGDGFVETGTFTMANPWKNLDSCYQFRWYQIITKIPEDIRTDDQVKFKDDKGKYTVSPVVPFVDPPAGGYKYQEKGGGADNDPFYENTGPGKYAYPNYDPSRHTLHENTRTDDNPGPEDVYFETYLVAYHGPEKEFCVLAGYSWNTHLTDGKVTDPVQIAAGSFDMGKLNTALQNSGFKDWTAMDDCTLSPCPEPSTLMLLGAGVVCIGLKWHRRRLQPALA